MQLVSRSIATLLILTLISMTTTAPLAAKERDRNRATAADLANQQASEELLRAYVSKLPIGSIVKVKMKEGKGVKGTLMVIEPDAIVVKPKTRVAVPERRLALAEIEFVELQERNGSNTVKAVAVGLATGAGAFFGLMLLAIAVIDD